MRKEIKFVGFHLVFWSCGQNVKNPSIMLGGRKTVICEFLGTGMISVMPVSLL